MRSCCVAVTGFTGPRGVDRVGVGDQHVEAVAGDLGDLDEGGLALLHRGVVEALVALRDQRLDVLHVTHAGDQRHVEPRAVGVGQPVDLQLFLLGQVGQAVHALLLRRVGPARTLLHLASAEVGVGRDQLVLLRGVGGEQRLLERVPQVTGVAERALVVRPLDHPVGPLEQPAEGRDELLTLHLVDLVEADQVARLARDGRTDVLADVVEDEVEDDRGQAAQRDARSEQDLGPVGHRLRHARLHRDVDGQADRGRDDDDVAVVVEVDARQGLEADDGDRGEHRERRAPQHRVGDAGDERSRLGGSDPARS